MHFFQSQVTMQKKSISLAVKQTIALGFLKNIIIAVTVSLGRPEAKSIYIIFLLRIKSNAQKKSTAKPNKLDLE